MTEMPHHNIPELTLGWRLKMALESGGLKSADLEEMFEVSRNTVSRWLNDKAEPKRLFLREIAMRTGVDYQWLLTGKSPRHPDGGDGGVSLVELPRLDSNQQPFGRRIAALRPALSAA